MLASYETHCSFRISYEETKGLLETTRKFDHNNLMILLFI